MKSQSKLDIVIKAIEEARNITPKGEDVKVYLSNILESNQIRLQELYAILRKLEDDEKILTLMRFPRHLLKLNLASFNYTDMLTGERVNPMKEDFTVRINASFDERSANYRILTNKPARKRKPKNPLAKKLYSEAKDIGTTIIAKVINEKTN